MKSALTPTRTAFFNAITALGYAVYDRPRKVHDYPHVIIGEQTEVQDSDQSNYGRIATINIEVVDGWASDYGSRETSDTMTNAIMQAILTRPETLDIVGFNYPMLVMDNIMSSTEQTKTQTIVTTVIRFKMWLWANNDTGFVLSVTNTGDIAIPLNADNDLRWFINSLTASWVIIFGDDLGNQIVANGLGITSIQTVTFTNHGLSEAGRVISFMLNSSTLCVLLSWSDPRSDPDDSSFFRLTANGTISSQITISI